MILENPWVGYLTRSYRTIKASLLSKLIIKAPEITDLSESNILVIIITMFAGLVEQLHYYIDNWSRESYLSTCRLFSSAIKLTRILDYRVKASLPSYVDLYVTYLDSNGNPVNITENGIIPVGTEISTLNGIKFLTSKDLTITPGKSFGVVSSKQWERITNDNIGTTDGSANQKYLLPLDYAQDTLEITINSITWNRQKTLARSLATDKDFIIDVDVDGTPYVLFGNGVKGSKPAANFGVIANYYITDGADGNNVSEQTINQITETLSLPAPAVSVRITNQLSPVGGYGIETIDDIRTNAPLTIRTLDRAVTEQDYTDMALQANSIVKAKVINTCGKNLETYVAPAGGGLATDQLLSDTKDFLETVKMVTTHLDVYAAGITPVYVELNVKARFRVDKVQCSLDCEDALINKFSFDNQAINGRIALSDVIALIDNLDRVDTVELVKIYTLPYPFPMLENTIPLDWTRTTNAGSTNKNVWRIVYTGTDLRIYKNGSFLTNAPINILYTDPFNIITFRVNPGMYSVGDYWEFTTYPYNTSIQLDDNTIPIIVAGTTNITVS